MIKPICRGSELNYILDTFQVSAFISAMSGKNRATI